MKNFSFKNVMYAIGTSLFLIMLIFTLSTSLINPTYGMSEGAVMEITASSASGSTIICCKNSNNEECARVIVNGVLHYFAGPKC